MILCKKNWFRKTFEKTDLRFELFIFVGEDLYNILIANNQLIINYLKLTSDSKSQHSQTFCLSFLENVNIKMFFWSFADRQSQVNSLEKLNWNHFNWTKHYNSSEAFQLNSTTFTFDTTVHNKKYHERPDGFTCLSTRIRLLKFMYVYSVFDCWDLLHWYYNYPVRNKPDHKKTMCSKEK